MQTETEKRQNQKNNENGSMPCQPPVALIMNLSDSSAETISRNQGERTRSFSERTSHGAGENGHFYSEQRWRRC